MRLKTLFLVAVFIFASTIFAQEPITLDNAESISILNDFSDEDRDFQGGALSPDGSLIAVFDIRNDAVIVFDAESGDVVLEIPFPEDVYEDLITFNSDGSQLIVLWDSGEANFYDVESGESLGDTMFDFPLDFAGERTVAIRLDMETEELLVYVTEGDELIFENAVPGVTGLPVISADGSTIAFANEADVYVVDVEAGDIGEPFVSVEGEYAYVESIALNSDGSVIAVSNDDEYNGFVFDVESGDELYTIEFEENSDPLDNLMFSPDDSILYMNVYNAVVLVDGTNGELITFLEFPVQGRIAAFGMSDDGSTLFAASYEGLIVIGIEE